MPLFDASTASASRVQAQEFIMSAIRRGLNGAQTIRVLQQSDNWYDSKLYGKDWAYWKAAWNKADHLKFVTRDAHPTEGLYVESKWRRASKYQTVMELRGHDRMTGQAFTQHVTVLHTHDFDGIEMDDQQQLYTRRELEDSAERYLDWYGLRDTIEVDSIVPIIGYVNPEL